MRNSGARFISGAIGAAAFSAALLVLHWPLWLCLLAALVLYGGASRLVGGGSRELPAGGKSPLEALTAQVRNDQRKVRKLRVLSRSVDNRDIRTRIESVCDLAEKIFRNFKEDPQDLPKAHRFLSHFQKVLPIVEDYVHLASDKDRQAVLSEADETDIAETLIALESNLRDAYVAFQENNRQRLRLASGTLKRMIEFDRTVKGGNRKNG